MILWRTSKGLGLLAVERVSRSWHWPRQSTFRLRVTRCTASRLPRWYIVEAYSAPWVGCHGPRKGHETSRMAHPRPGSAVLVCWYGQGHPVRRRRDKRRILASVQPQIRGREGSQAVESALVTCQLRSNSGPAEERRRRELHVGESGPPATLRLSLTCPSPGG